MMKKVLTTSLVVILSALYSFAAYAEFATGTDDDGVFYFPQEMAEWCSINFKDKIDYATIEACFAKISDDIKASNETDAAQAKKRLGNLRKEVWVNAFILSHEIKQKYANEKIEEKAEDITDKAGMDGRTQTSGNSEIEKFILDQYYDLRRLEAATLEMMVYKTLSTNSDVFETKDEAKQ